MKRTPMPPKREKPRRTGKPMPRIKAKREENPEYLKAIRALPCLACKMDGTEQTSPTEPHHPRTGENGGPGASQKAPDDQAIPLCRKHHNEQHPGSFSIHRNPIEFHLKYGSIAFLLKFAAAWLNGREAA